MVVRMPFDYLDDMRLLLSQYLCLPFYDLINGTAMVAIHPRFTEIITALRTAQATENRLDKTTTAFDDTLDSLRINLSYYRRGK